jgi:flagellar capping protein FliD
VGEAVEGIDAEVNSLTMVGYTLKGDGTLEFDEDTFKSALDSNLEGVTDLFSGVIDRALGSQGASISAAPAAAAGYNADGIINGNSDEDDFDSSANGFLSANTITADGGSHQFVVDFGGTRSIKQLFLYTTSGDGIRDFTVELQDSGGTWQSIEAVSGFSGTLWSDVLSDPMSAQAMRVTVTAANTDDYTRILEIKAKEEAGIGHRLGNQLDFVTRGIDGAIAGEQEAIDNRISDYEDQIAEMEERLIAKEERLRAEFTAMEMALQQMQSQANYFLTQLSQMSAPKTSS